MVRVLAALVVAVAALAAPAAAEVRVARTSVSEIELAGRAVAYTEWTTKVHDFQSVFFNSRIVLRVPGGRPRKLAEGSDYTNYELDENSNTDVEWDASAEAFATAEILSVNRAAGTDDYTTVRGGPLGGPVRRLARCEFGPYAPSVGVDGSVVAYEDTCRKFGDDGIVVRRLDDPGAEPRFVPLEFTGRVDLAGNYVTSAAEDRLDVIDWTSGAVLYSAEAPFTRRGEDVELYRAGELDIQDDGTVVALLRRRKGPCAVAWFSAAEPRPHVIGRSPCSGDVRIHSGRVAWVAIDGSGRRLVVADLAGTTRTVARSRAATIFSWFDFDGRRFAYAVSRCDERAVLLLRPSPEGPVWVDRDPLRCPLRVPTTNITVPGRRAHAKLPVRCARGCKGDVYLRKGSREQPFSVHSTGRHLTVHLDARAHRNLDHRGSATLPIRLQHLDRTGRIAGTRKLTLHLRSG